LSPYLAVLTYAVVGAVLIPLGFAVFRTQYQYIDVILAALAGAALSFISTLGGVASFAGSVGVLPSCFFSCTSENRRVRERPAYLLRLSPNKRLERPVPGGGARCARQNYFARTARKLRRQPAAQARR
jgi:hypothetical protein